LPTPFDRAESRDFADFYFLTRRYDTGSLEHRAAQMDPGFALEDLVSMIGSLERFDDDDSSVSSSDVAVSREFFGRSRDNLSAGEGIRVELRDSGLMINSDHRRYVAGVSNAAASLVHHRRAQVARSTGVMNSSAGVLPRPVVVERRRRNVVAVPTTRGLERQ
jgi:hypothetical protein